MNHHHLMTLANETMAARRAEADRARLVRSARPARAGRAARTADAAGQSPRRHRSLGAFLHRVASF